MLHEVDEELGRKDRDEMRRDAGNESSEMLQCYQVKIEP